MCIKRLCNPFLPLENNLRTNERINNRMTDWLTSHVFVGWFVFIIFLYKNKCSIFCTHNTLGCKKYCNIIQTRVLKRNKLYLKYYIFKSMNCFNIFISQQKRKLNYYIVFILLNPLKPQCLAWTLQKKREFV